MAYAASQLSPWFYQLWLGLQMVAPYKTVKQEAVWPLGLRNPLTKLFHKEVMVQNRVEMRLSSWSRSSWG